MQQNQDKRPAHVRSASQGYHEIWNSAPFVCGKTWPCLKKKVAWRKFSIHSLQVESIFPVAHNEEKVKRTSLCFLCFYVKMDVFRSQYAKMNVFAKPNEQCRACSNIVMARKRTFRWTGKERLTRSLIHSSTCQLVHSSTRQLVHSSTRQLAKYCQFFSRKFNTMSALFIHQLLTLPQKIDSREGLFRCQIG